MGISEGPERDRGPPESTWSHLTTCLLTINYNHPEHPHQHMSKRAATGSRPPRKRKKGGANHESINFDSVVALKRQTEEVRVWNVSASGSSGRLSAKRKNRQHAHESPPEPSCQELPLEEPFPDPEDASEVRPTKSVARSRKARVEDNDSVSSMQIFLWD